MFSFLGSSGTYPSGYHKDTSARALRRMCLTVRSIAAKRKNLYTEKIDVYCTCLMPDTYGYMVQSLCENCHNLTWFHTECVELVFSCTLPNCDGKFFLCVRSGCIE